MPYVIGGLAAAGAVGKLFGDDDDNGVIGKDTTKSPTFDQTPAYDPNRYEFGGVPGLAKGMADRFHQQGDQAQGRTAGQANYSNAAQWGNNVASDRAAQGGAANLMMNRALGYTPSIAGQQASQDIGMLQRGGQQQQQAAIAAQGAQAASARGAAGVALAQQSAANNSANASSAIGAQTAQATQNISGQAQVNAAAERERAENNAANAFTNMRSGDTDMVEGDSRRAEFNAGLEDRQRGRNDAFTRDMADNERAVYDSKMKGDLTQQDTLARSYGADAASHQAQGAATQAGTRQLITSAATNAANSQYSDPNGGGRAKGGPVAVGTPYLVGEKGPELIVPRYDGTVIPAGPTAALLRGGAHARAKGGPTTGVRMLSPQKAGQVAVMGQPNAPALSRGGKGKNLVARAPATVPMGQYLDERSLDMKRDPDYDRAIAAAAPPSPDEDPRMKAMLDDRHEQATSGTPSDPKLQEMLDDRAAQTQPAPAAATTDDQAKFDRKLTGQPEPEGRYMAPDISDADADKIRANFAADQQRDEATKRWEASYGAPDGASAGARDASAAPSAESSDASKHGRSPLWERAMLMASGYHRRREDGGPVDGVKVTSKPGFRVTSSDKPTADAPDMKVTDKPGFRVTSSDTPPSWAPREMTSFTRTDAGREAERLALAESAKKDAATSSSGPLAYLPAVTPTDVRAAVNAQRAKSMDTSYKPGEATYRDERTGETHGEEAERARQAAAAGGLASALFSPASSIIQAGVETGKDASELKRRALLALTKGGKKK